MAHDNLERIRGGYEAYARRDFEAVFALLADDVEIWQTDLLPWGGYYRGHDRARAFFRSLAEHVDAAPEPLVLIPAGPDVAVSGRLRGNVRSNGRAFDVPIIHVWTICDGRVTRFVSYIDTPAMLDALGGEGAGRADGRKAGDQSRPGAGSASGRVTSMRSQQSAPRT